MRARVLKCLLALAVLLPCVDAASAAVVHGTVKNATTGKPGEGVEVILIQLQGSMQPIMNTKTDAQGQFSFDNPEIGKAPMLIRAVYHGVNFHQPLPPGKDNVEVQVYEISQDAKSIAVPSHVVIFQPNGASLTVGEEYSIQNSTQPPQAFFRADGNFEVQLPEKADLQQIAAWGPSGMPVVQAPIDKGHGKYAVAFAFHPGESGVRFSYQLPYPGNSASIKLPSIYPNARLIVVAPPTVQVQSDGLQASGQEQGMNVYQRLATGSSAVVAINVSGTAPPPSQAGGNGAETPQEAADARQGNEGGADAASVQVVPGRLDALKWPLVVGFVAVFAVAAILLARKPVGPMAAAATGGSTRVPESSTPAARSKTTANQLAAVDEQIGNSLDALKEQLFRLELRRQAGTISEEEYAAERTRAEKVLRDLVRG